MKEFFEEYGRVIVTVLVILGIILIGYVIAGNGKTSAFGRFTSNIVDTLTRQDSSLIKGDSAYIERTAQNKHSPKKIGKNASGVQMESEEKEGIIYTAVTGKADPTWDSKTTAATSTEDYTPVPWGKKSVMSFDLYSDRDSKVWIDRNAMIEGVTGNDNYSNEVGVYLDGEAAVRNTVTVSSGQWHHCTVICVNEDGYKNPEHKPYKWMWNSIAYGQNGGTTHYQIKNLKYGVAD